MGMEWDFFYVGGCVGGCVWIGKSKSVNER